MLTHELLTERFNYDEHTGDLTYAYTKKGQFVKGTIAGRVSKNNSRIVQINHKQYRCVDIVYFIKTGEFPRYSLSLKDKNIRNLRFDNITDEIKRPKRTYDLKEGYNEYQMLTNSENSAVIISRNTNILTLRTIRPSLWGGSLCENDLNPEVKVSAKKVYRYYKYDRNVRIDFN